MSDQFVGSIVVEMGHSQLRRPSPIFHELVQLQIKAKVSGQFGIGQNPSREDEPVVSIGLHLLLRQDFSHGFMRGFGLQAAVLRAKRLKSGKLRPGDRTHVRQP